LMVLLTLMLNKTKIGKAVRATSESAETAGLLGINTGRIITFTVMLASALGAAAGVLIGLSFNAIEPTMGTAMGRQRPRGPHHGRVSEMWKAPWPGDSSSASRKCSASLTARRPTATRWLSVISHSDPLPSSGRALLEIGERGPAVMEELLNGYFLQVFTFICINIILAFSIYMTVCTGIISLGNAGFMSFGAYTAAILSTQYHMPMPVGIVAGGCIAAAVALIVGLPTIRLRGLYLAIATLGFGEVVRVIALNLDITHGALGYSGIPSMATSLSQYAEEWGLLDALDMDSQTGGQFLACVILLILVVLLITFWYRLEHSRVGRAMAAVKADEYAASLTGINVVYYKMLGFLFSAFFAGFAGALYAHTTFFISPTDFSWHKVVDMLLYTVFGGSNVMWGPVLGATISPSCPNPSAPSRNTVTSSTASCSWRSWPSVPTASFPTTP